MKYKVIGLKFNEGTEDIAIFSDKKIASQHLKTTFDTLGFDRLFIQPVANNCKDAPFIPDDVAENKDTFLISKIVMSVLNWEEIVITQTSGTLTEFLLPFSNVLQTKSQVDKLLDVGVESSNEETGVESVSLKVVHNENTPLPYKKIVKQLQKELENALIGVGEVEETEETTTESVETTTKVKEEKVDEQAKIDAENKDKEKKEKADKKAKEKQDKLDAQAKIDAENKANEEKSTQTKTSSKSFDYQIDL